MPRYKIRERLLNYIKKTLLLIVLLPTFIGGASARVSWQANTESDLAGYKIYYGTQSQSYSTTINVGNILQYSVSGLSEETTYYFAVTAYDETGNESSFSTEVSLTVSDETAPDVVSVTCLASDQVEIVFSEPIEETSAEIESNYKIDSGAIVVQDAELQSDNITVLLTTTEHSEGTHSIVINNIRDCATIPNTIATNTTKSYKFSSTDTEGPRLLSVTISRGAENDILTLRFNEAIKSAEAYESSNYEISPTITVQSTGLSSDQKTVILYTGFHTSNQTYTLTVLNVQDAYGNVIDASYSSQDYEYASSDAAPVLLAARIVNATQLELDFNEKLDHTSATTFANYSFTPTVAIVSATLSTDEMTVILTTTSHSEDDYTVTVTNIADQASPANVASSQSKSYTYSAPDNTAPVLEGAELIAENILSVTFSEALDEESTETAANYKITSSTGSSITIYSANLMYDGMTVYLYTDSHVDGTFTLTVSNVKDVSGNVIVSKSTTTYLYDLPDRVKPTIVKATLHGADILDITFSEALDQVSAETESNYSISPSVTIQEAKLVGDTLNHVYLHTSDHQVGVSYTVTVNNVKDQAETPNTILSNSQQSYLYVENDTEAPRLVAASLKGEKFLELTFSETLDETQALVTTNYRISGSGSTVSVSDAQLDLSLKKVYLTTGAHEVGVTYTVTVYNVQDLATPANTIGSENYKTYVLNVQDQVRPYVKGVELFGDDVLEILYSEPVDQKTATNLSNFTLSRNGTGTVPILLKASMSNAANVVWLTTSPHQSGDYFVTVRNIQDLANIPNVMLAEETLPYDYTPPDVVAPRFIQLSDLADNMLELEFSEELDSESAEDTDNYQISDGIQVISARLEACLWKVLLQTSDHTPGGYEITIQGIEDQYGNAMDATTETYEILRDDTERPTIVAAVLNSDHQLVVTFSETLDSESAENTDNYGINNNIDVKNVFLNSTLKQVVIETSTHVAGEYKITVNGVKDASTNLNAILPYSQFPYTWNPADTVAPVLDSAELITDTNLELVFSEAINATDANNVDNYLIDPQVAIKRASLQSEGNRVWLITEAHETGTYTITVLNVHDRAFTPNLIGSKNQKQYVWSLADTSAPNLVHVELRTQNYLELVFDEEITSKSAKTLANYEITPKTAVNGAYLLDDHKTVHLETAAHSTGVKYTIKVSDIEDRAPVANAMKSSQSKTYSMESTDTTPPFVQTVKLQGSTQLEILFSEKVDQTTAETRSNYTIRSGVEVQNAILDTSSMMKVVLETTMHLPGIAYEINALNIKDLAAVPNVIESKWVEYSLSTTTTMADNAPPQIARIDAKSSSKIDVLFTEQVEQTSAEKVANYVIQDSVTVLSATLDTNLVRVHLVTSSHDEGKLYTIQVNNIRDRATTPNQLTDGDAISYIISNGVSVSQLSRSDYTLNTLAVEGALYADRDYTVAQAPEDLYGAMQILTCNDDKIDTSSAFLYFEVLGDAQAIVGYDKSQSIPTWLKSWKSTGEQVISSNSTVYNLYSKTVQSDRLTLGGNSGTMDDNMYIVFIKPMLASTSLVTSLSKSGYELSHIEVGDAYYIDRDYVIAEIPDSLESLLWIKTANDDKTSQESEFMNFTLKLKSLVHVAYDAQIVSLPEWLSEWNQTDYEVVDSRGTRFTVFEKEYSAGEVVLGGNFGADDENMYLVLIKPLEKANEEGTADLPGYFTLAQNYPNPFNPETTIRFRVHKAGHATLTIYNILGQRVRVLFDKRVMAGYQEDIVWDGRDENGRMVATGVYFYRIAQGHFAKTKRMMLIK